MSDPDAQGRVAQAPSPWLDVAAGSSVGGLLGFLIGMSISPIVAPVTTGLVAVLLSLLGLRSGKVGEKLSEALAEKVAAKKKADASDEKKADASDEKKADASDEKKKADASMPPAPEGLPILTTASDARRILGFGLGCVLATMLGLHARTHDWFGLSFQERLLAHKAAWEKTGFGEVQARELAAWSAAGAWPVAAQDPVKAPTNWFSPEFGARLLAHKQAWEEAGYEPKKARDLAAWSAVGAWLTVAQEPSGSAPAVPEELAAKSRSALGASGGEGSKTPAPSSTAQRAASSDPNASSAAHYRSDHGVLFTDPKRHTKCEELRRFSFATADAAIDRFRAVGWHQVADRAMHIHKNNAERLQYLEAEVEHLCPKKTK